jgi:hypothetical protein
MLEVQVAARRGLSIDHPNLIIMPTTHTHIHVDHPYQDHVGVVMVVSPWTMTMIHLEDHHHDHPLQCIFLCRGRGVPEHNQ